VKMETYTCDICAEIIDTKQKWSGIHASIPVVFTTEQTEGRPIQPYLAQQGMDICHLCYAKIIKGKLPFGAGAQGYNRYCFKDESPV